MWRYVLITMWAVAVSTALIWLFWNEPWDNAPDNAPDITMLRCEEALDLRQEVVDSLGNSGGQTYAVRTELDDRLREAHREIRRYC